MKRFLTKHAPTILTCLGSVGVIATAVTAIRATPKAINLLNDKRLEKGEELTVLESVKTVAPIYIPTAGLAVATIESLNGENTLDFQVIFSDKNIVRSINENSTFELFGQWMII